jgi:hypothetical protein
MVAAATADANDAWPFKTARERVLDAMRAAASQLAHQAALLSAPRQALAHAGRPGALAHINRPVRPARKRTTLRGADEGRATAQGAVRQNIPALEVWVCPSCSTSHNSVAPHVAEEWARIGCPAWRGNRGVAPAPKVAVQAFRISFFKDHLEAEVTPRPRTPTWTPAGVDGALRRLRRRRQPSSTVEEAWTASGPLRISAVAVQNALAEAPTPPDVVRILALIAAVATCRARDGRPGLCASSYKRNPFMPGQVLYPAVVGTICAQARHARLPTPRRPPRATHARFRRALPPSAGDG